MRASQFFIKTLKEAPADAEIPSQIYSARAGLIKKLAAGVFTFMPMGMRVMRKISRIIREEMDAAGAIELSMPIVQPAELWQESGRWNKYGPELLRFKDRHQRDFVIQPTSEEVITDLARQEITSWRQLPVNFYQIRTKFRDERRPRFGVMRAREFVMKDAYSFDRDAEAAGKSYEIMFDAYTKIFTRLGLVFRAVRARRLWINLPYNLLRSEEADNLAEIVAEQMQCDIVEITGSVHPLKFGKRYVQTANAIEFISLIKNAAFVITSSFHGTAFSLIFRKQFYSIGMGKRAGRVESLLEQLGICDRLIKKTDDLPINKIDYTILQSKIQSLVLQSQKYLIDAVRVSQK